MLKNQEHKGMLYLKPMKKSIKNERFESLDTSHNIPKEKSKSNTYQNLPKPTNLVKREKEK